MKQTNHNDYMNELFVSLGYSEKESRIYRYLLEEGLKTAAQIAEDVDETRTNTYMILERLEKAELVKSDDTQAIRRYEIADPIVLKQSVFNKQQELRQIQMLLNQNLPKLQSLYSLSQLKQGVVYLEGLSGLETMLSDMARTKSEVLLIPSREVPGIPDTWKALKKGIEKRSKLGVKTRAIFQENARGMLDSQLHKRQKFEVRYWGTEEYPGELAVYGDKCVFTTYKPVIINTILTNQVMAETLRAIFEEIWKVARA